MSLCLLSPPSTEPVTLADLKTHLKIDTGDEDGLLTTLITAARARAEWHTGRAFITQSWVLRLDHWPKNNIAEIPLPPLQSVSTIAVTTGDNLRALLASSDYRVDTASEPGRVILPKPPPNLRAQDCLEISFLAGYGAAAPASVAEAILQIAAELYTYRGDQSAIVSPAGAALLAPYRIFKL
jgi:uncharacterized phiE125 gp8 family phage protein